MPEGLDIISKDQILWWSQYVRELGYMSKDKMMYQRFERSAKKSNNMSEEKIMN